jgi:uncharacterized SAM-binding protein YcdF (DUF218 family)
MPASQDMPRPTESAATESRAGALFRLRRPAARLSLLLVTAALLAWLGGLQWFAMGLEEAPPLNLKPADAVVVLTGGSNRLESGFDLLKKGLGRRLFISGVYRGVDVKVLLERLEKADRSGFDCCVDLGFEADDTIGNARETTQWLKKNEFKSFYLVTANYHMARALLVFRTFAPQLEARPYPVDSEALHGKTWWAESRTRNLILREYMKYLVTLAWSVLP